MVAGFLFFLLLTSFSLQGSTMLESEAGDAFYTIESTITYSNEGTEVWNLTEEDRTVSRFMNNTWQAVNMTQHSHPFESVALDEDENPIAVMKSQSKLSPGENISYSVTYQVHSKPRSIPQIAEEQSGSLADIPESLRNEYCKPGDMWQTEDETIRELTLSIVQNETNALKIVKRLVGWIWQNITYKSHEGPLYPNQTLLLGEGDCDDQAILLITFCRILKIPAYLQIGCIYLPSKHKNETGWDGHITYVEKQIGWHGWAMVYVPPWGWLPVDLTYPLGGFGNPLNSLATAVVTDVRTVQYMNINEVDYVASSWSFQEFIKENDFYVFAEDEMTKIAQEGLWNNLVEKWVQRIPAIVVTATCGIIFVIAYMSRLEKKKEGETAQPNRID